MGNVAKACRYFGISREIFYKWKGQYTEMGDPELVNSKPCLQNPKLRLAREIEDKILYLRTSYHFGPQRIVWSLERYFGMKVSTSKVRNVLLRHGLNRLPGGARKRSVKDFKRYQKQVPCHRVQVDVKFLTFYKDGGKIRRFQYTAIDDATRSRALRVYERHTQANAQDFVDYIRQTFPFRIHTIQTDNGHEFQAKFHWHCEDLVIRHVYIKPALPHLNGKVERSHRTDKQEFWQLVDYVDIKAKLKEREIYYNCHRPHSNLGGKAPFEVLREKLQMQPEIS